MAYSQGSMSKRGLYYLKDKKAQIYKTDVTTDKYKNRITVYRPVAPSDLWCYTRQLTQEQIFGAAAYYEHETRVFVFNYREGIKPADFVLYNGEWFEITRVDTPEDYTTGMDMFIYVKESENHITEDRIMEYGE